MTRKSKSFGRTSLRFIRNRNKIAKALPVMVVKAKRRRRRGPKLGALLKPKLTVKLRYTDIVAINPASGGIATHVFRASSIFDPDSTGAGHQPLLHDEYALLYKRYRVLSSKIKVTPVADTAAGTSPGLYGVFTDKDQALTYTTSTSIIEDKTRSKRWAMTGSASAFASYPGFNRSLSSTYSAKRNLGKEGATEVTDFGSNPTDEAQNFYQIWYGSLLANDPGSQPFVVSIEYICELSDPVVVTQS